MKGELKTICKGSYSSEDYLHKTKSLALSLRGAGKPMDDDDLIICILSGLGYEFDPIVATLNARDMFPSLEDDEAAQYKDFDAIQVRDNVKDNWYPDTGANQHMTPNFSEVQGINSYSSTDTVMVGNGNGLSIVGTGHTNIPTTKLKLNNELVVPEIKKKILSVSQFTQDNNYYFLFFHRDFFSMT
uniref:Retrovirus-related Pol polyprotein from transposon TNT 1-94-like beta-barrel domain-containing protein n=1 Tax=Populus alba TaxID=43335 RepID=A0A4U5R3H1_POPAL|nr:hypothetical protein D5086_0000020980 [Populus alba]